MEGIIETHKVEIGNCTLYFGNCYDVLKELDTDSVTLVHSDPPYIMGTIYLLATKMGWCFKFC